MNDLNEFVVAKSIGGRYIVCERFERILATGRSTDRTVPNRPCSTLATRGYPLMIVASENFQANNRRPSGPRSGRYLRHDLRLRARRLLQNEIEFIDNPAFRQAAADADGDEMPAQATIGETSESAAFHDALRDAGTLTALCSAPLLTPAQETDLFRRMNLAKYRAHVLRQQIDDARPVRDLIERAEWLIGEATRLRNVIMQSNLRLVVSIAKRFAGSRYTLDDLIDEGVFALVRAVEKFDFDRGFRFSTYATRAIQRAMVRWLSRRREDDERFRATPEETLAASAGEAPAAAYSQHRWEQLQSALRALLEQLDDREQAIVQARFGMGSENKVQTLSTLARQFGVCKERIRQLEKRAIDKLRDLAAEMHFEEAEA